MAQLFSIVPFYLCFALLHYWSQVQPYILDDDDEGDDLDVDADAELSE